MDLYSEQDAETKIIVPALRDLGYDETDPSKAVMLRFQHPITVHQGRERKTIHADIVVFIHDTPVIVVDAKNPREFLTENDQGQVISYARLIGDVAPYAALCNGITWQVFDSITKQQIKALPAYNDLILDLQRRRLTLSQRENIVAQATRTLFAIDSARDLSRIMRRCHDVIRNLKGYDPTKAFDELSKLLFAKMYEEREVADGKRMTNRFTAATVLEMRKQGVEIIQTLWNDTVKSDRYRGVFSDSDVENGIDLPPEAINEIVAILEDKSLGLTDLDVKGVAFEEFLASTYRGGGLGQYFTPREVVNFMVDLVSPNIGESIIDPACGTGGFLIRVYDMVSGKIRDSEFSAARKDEQLEALANVCLVGIDWESRAARTCKMNMIIHGDGHAGVYQANALDLEEVTEKVRRRQRFFPKAPDVKEGTFDIVLTNPPFGAKDKLTRILKEYEIGKQSASQKREVLFIQRCIRLLRPGGRMVVVIPEGILSNKNDSRVRGLIRRECIINAVVRLPQDAFSMSEGAACTSILYLTKKSDKKSSQGDIFFARAEFIGISPSGEPIARNDLLTIKEDFREFERGRWKGLEIQSVDSEHMVVSPRETTSESYLWLEPDVNRTSLLYDRLSYVMRFPKINDRFSYTYDHPSYWRISHSLDAMACDVVTLQSLCVPGYPTRGKKPSEESMGGIPVIKVRNVTGREIVMQTEYAPDSEEIRRECARALLKKSDILITSTGEGTIGRINVYPYSDAPAIADGHITICRLHDGVNLEYVVEFLRSEYAQIQFLRNVSGSTGQTELLCDYIEGLRIPIPAPNIQSEIVHFMESARTEADELAQRARALRLEGANTIASAQHRMLNLFSVQ